MKSILIYKNPDTGDNGGNNPEDEGGGSQNTYLSGNETDLADTADRVNTTWATRKDITIAYMKQTDFGGYITNFSSGIDGSSKGKSKKSSQANSLQSLDKQADDGISDLKLSIRKKFGKSYLSQYSRYGIIKTGDSYELPYDREKRLKAFDLVLAAITDDGFTNEKYGTAFWTKLKTDYTTALKAQKKTNEDRSGAVGNKNLDKAMVIKVLRSLLKILEGNYPDNFDQVALQWGFRKTGK